MKGDVGGVVSRAPSSGVVAPISAVVGKLSVNGTVVSDTEVWGTFAELEFRAG